MQQHHDMNIHRGLNATWELIINFMNKMHYLSIPRDPLFNQ